MAVVTVARWEAGEVDVARELEEGHIVVFPRSPIEVSEDDRAFLLSQRMVSGPRHKNIAYRPARRLVTNFERQRPGDEARLRDALERYSDRATAFVKRLVPRYAAGVNLDYASFRPIEERGRELPLRSRNDLLHVDAFPTRPTHGDRILRCFVNINPAAPRVWVTAERFDELAGRFAESSGLLARAKAGGVRRAALRVANSVGLPVSVRSPYDEFMLAFHHFLKENADWQASARKLRSEFPPGSAWMVYTDLVSHAVVAGQYALEQTFIVSRAVMARPEKSPVSVLERLAGRPMA